MNTTTTNYPTWQDVLVEGRLDRRGGLVPRGSPPEQERRRLLSLGGHRIVRRRCDQSGPPATSVARWNALHGVETVPG